MTQESIVTIEPTEQGNLYRANGKTAGPVPFSRENEISFDSDTAVQLGVEKGEVFRARLKARQLHSSLPKMMEHENKILEVLSGEDRPIEVSGYDICSDFAIGTVFIPCKTKEQDKRNVPKERYEDIPFVVLFDNEGVKQGWSPIASDGLLLIDRRKLRVRSVLPFSHSLSATAVDLIEQGTVIDPETVFQITRNFISHRVDFHVPYYYELAAIWAIASHFHQAFNAFPFLKFEGPAGCGKTTANNTTCSIAFHPLTTPDMSDASFFRMREALGVTVCLDERDFNKKTESRFNDFLNNSFTKGGTVPRIDKDIKGGLVAHMFAVFGPFSFSGVQDLPYMTETRTLIFSMKKTLDRRYSGTIPQLNDPDVVKIRNQLYILRLRLGAKIARIYRELNVEDYPIEHRAWDMARPLIAVAKIFAPNIIPIIISAINEQVTENAENAEERPEIKVLLALNDLANTALEENAKVEQMGLEIKPIKQTILSLFEDESDGYWTHKRIGGCLRKLSFKRNPGTRSGKKGNFKYTIRIPEIHDWLDRLGLNGRNTEHPERSTANESSARSELQLPHSQTRLSSEPKLSSEHSEVQKSSTLETEHSEHTEQESDNRKRDQWSRSLSHLYFRHLDDFVSELVLNGVPQLEASQFVCGLDKAGRFLRDPEGFLELVRGGS